LRLTVDLAGRGILSTRKGKASAVHFVGFDLYKVFSTETSDIGTLIAQGYLTKLNDVGKHPPFFEGPDDWDYVSRIFNFNYTGIADERFNIKIGHFEVPYGLEQPINTNGTLRDMTHPGNLGIKADWGFTFNGDFPDFDYEVGLSRGTGIEYYDRGNPYALAGRIGTPRDRTTIVGASFFHGKVSNSRVVGLYKMGLADPSGVGSLEGITRRTRVGLDLQHFFESEWSLLGQVDYGRDYEQNIFNGLLEFDYEDPDERFLIFLQGTLYARRFHDGWDEAITSNLGIRYTPDNHWAISTMYRQILTTWFGTPRDSILFLQLRYRF